VFLSLAGQIESQLRDAYDQRHRLHGVTQSSLARALGVNRSAINHRLRGLTNMTVETLADMVWGLGCAIKVTIYDPAQVSQNHTIADVDIPASPRAQREVKPEPPSSSNGTLLFPDQRERTFETKPTTDTMVLA
jgi:plasmid maintenance system antidote protein VapI